jgi:hypothetical protein
MLQKLWARAESQTETWPRQEDAWSDWHSIRLRQEVTYRSLRAVIEARNAIVHGLGYLTRRQLSDDGGRKVRDVLARLGIATVGQRVVVDEDAMWRCLTAARGFIEWLDIETQARDLRENIS